MQNISQEVRASGQEKPFELVKVIFWVAIGIASISVLISKVATLF